MPGMILVRANNHRHDQPSQSQRWHHSFRLRCDQNRELVLTDNFEFHIFELPKFKPTSDNIGELSSVEKWFYLLTHAAEVEPEILANQLG